MGNILGVYDMLKASNVPIDLFLPVFASTGVPVAFLVPTPTGYGKSIMDATAPVRDLLKAAHVHDYEIQLQGPAHKHIVKSYFVTPDRLVETTASLYRPVTKHGDPRIWFSNLKQYCEPFNLLALIIINDEIYVLNLSNGLISYSLFHGGFVSDILQEAAYQNNRIAHELLGKIQAIHNQGFLPSVTTGDPGVGDTLENALGISRNNSKKPDYKGIELKTTRLTRDGRIRVETRSTLFTKVPDAGLTYKEIVLKYGKVQTPKGKTTPRLQLYDTLKMSRVNAYNLGLAMSGSGDFLQLIYEREGKRNLVSAWAMLKLKETLLTKHRETFWVKAVSVTRDGKEYFRYDKILHTKAPNASLLAPLLESDKITVDLAAHIKDDGSWKDHGVLFKMKPSDLHLLLGEPVEYNL